ncbi:MAG: hypothetical protein DRQ51_07680 [Gammaproteobacteria bacterium]|nr:MAG: hypothetical protein DRQ51_07680 [Gammaproteobacteria bacterium]
MKIDETKEKIALHSKLFFSTIAITVILVGALYEMIKNEYYGLLFVGSLVALFSLIIGSFMMFKYINFLIKKLREL